MGFLENLSPIIITAVAGTSRRLPAKRLLNRPRSVTRGFSKINLLEKHAPSIISNKSRLQLNDNRLAKSAGKRPRFL